jgi:dUTP pyrophosphatase
MKEEVRKQVINDEVLRIKDSLNKIVKVNSMNTTEGKVKIKFEKLFESVELPEYKSKGAAGFDLRAYIDAGDELKTMMGITNNGRNSITLHYGDQVIIRTGLKIAIPEGYELQIRPRSGLAAKNGITLTNSPGTIDSDYRGEVMIIVLNTSREPFVIQHGDRICQAVVNKVEQALFEEVESVDETERGEGGLGSTGVK